MKWLKQSDVPEVGSVAVSGGLPYLQLIEAVQQSLPRAGHFLQEVLSADYIKNLNQEQVLGRVSHPGVKDTVRLKNKHHKHKIINMRRFYPGICSDLI